MEGGRRDEAKTTRVPSDAPVSSLLPAHSVFLQLAGFGDMHVFTRSPVHYGLALGFNLCLAWTGISAEEPSDFKTEARQHYEQGQDLRKQGRLSEAIRAYEEAIKLGMDAFPRVHLQRAASNLDLKKYDTAVVQYTKFIKKFGLEESCRY
jgi:hypothetical protein